MAVALQTQAYRLPMPRDAAADGIAPRQWQVLVEAIFPTAKTPEAVMLAWSYCKARGLDPFRRPVNIVSMWNSQLRKEVETVWEGINGIEANAAKTAQWAGMDPAKWGPDVEAEFVGEIERWDKSANGKVRKEVRAAVTYPEWCEVTVYRLIGGQRCAFTETVYWIEAFASVGQSSVPNDMWCKRPRGQLHKCAKAAVLRTAFPEVAGYAAEEMEGRDIKGGGFVVEGRAEPEHDDVTGEVVEPVKATKLIPLLAPSGKVEAEYPSAGEWLTGLEFAVEKVDVEYINANWEFLVRIATSAKTPADLREQAEKLREMAPADDRAAA